MSTSGQKRLVRWALCDQARNNETNLDAHYVLPEEGLWNTYVNAQKNSGGDVLVQPRAQVCPERAAPEIPGRRKLVENTPASAENFEDIATSPKPPPTASPTVQPSPCSALIRKLRWANIGWFYHWGTKQYDFSKGKSTVNPEIIKVCRSAVELVDWRDVFSESSEDDMDWGEKGPDWQTWTETYGDIVISSGCSYFLTILFIKNLMQELSTSTKRRSDEICHFCKVINADPGALGHSNGTC